MIPTANDTEPSKTSRFKTLRSQLLISFGILTTVILTIMLLVDWYGIPFTSFNGHYTEKKQDAYDRVSLAADLTKERFERWAGERHDMTRALAADDPIASGIRRIAAIAPGGATARFDAAQWRAVRQRDFYRRLTDQLNLIGRTYDDILQARIVDLTSGTIIASSAEREIGGRVDNGVVLPSPGDGGLTGERVRFDITERDGQVRMHLLAMVGSGDPTLHTPERSPMAVLITVDLAKELRRIMAANREFGEHSEVVLYDDSLGLLTYPHSPIDQLTVRELLSFAANSVSIERVSSSQEGIVTTSDYRGVKVVAAYRHLDFAPNLGWGMVLKADRGAVLRDSQLAGRYILIVALIGLILMGWLCWAMANRLSRPLRQLGAVAQQARQGDFSVRAATDTEGEIGYLASSMNRMFEHCESWQSEMDKAVAERTLTLKKINESLQNVIAERRRTEDELKESKRVLTTLMTNLPGMAYQCRNDRDWTMEFVSKGCQELTGYRSDDLENNRRMSYNEIIHPRDRERVWKDVQAALIRKQPFKLIYRIVPCEGDVKWVWEQGQGVFDEQGELRGLEGFITDITASKLAEKALRESERKFATAFRSSPDSVLITRMSDNIVLDVNQGFLVTFDYERQNVIGRSAEQLVIWADQEDRKKFFATIEEQQECVGWETAFVGRKGRRIDALISARVIEIKGERCIISISRDITDIIRTQDALVKSESRYRMLVDTMNEGFAVIDKDHRITYGNHRFCEMIGRSPEELIGIYVGDLMDDENRQILESELKRRRQGREDSYKVQWISAAGEKIHTLMSPRIILDDDGRHAGSCAVITNITQLKQLEERVARSSKMASLGHLAGRVAHDLNNVLSGLVTYPDLLLSKIADDSPLRGTLQSIRESGERAAAIIDDLLTMARRGVRNVDVLNLNEIITNYLGSPECLHLRNEYPKVMITDKLQPDLFKIRGTEVHLARTIMNLVINAAEAMPDGGELKIVTCNKYVDAVIQGYDSVTEGDYVVLEISDTGTGIEGDDLNRIFEPFFTRKVTGHSGSGLGLTVVWNTVNDLKGYIDIHSTPGNGSTFRLYFPISREKIEHANNDGKLDDLKGRGEKILVVDDAPQQRQLACDMLSVLGYNPRAVSSGEEALENIKINSADMILLDMVMGDGMDGLDTYRRILEIEPNQKAVISSGFAETDRVKEALRLGASKFVKKPYAIQDIAEAIKTGFGQRRR